MQIIIIAAIANNNTIGKDNKLPWHYKEDFQHFKQLTLNHVIVMGRKTFESIGKPLPNRINIVVSRNKDLIIEGCTIAHSLQDAIIFCKKNNVEKIFIIGGSSLFIEGLVIADAMELTLIHKDVEGDVYFPQWDKNQWTEISRENKEEFSFARYEKKMNTKTNAIVILYTDNNKILMQDRRNIRKWGEEWGFFGGGVESGETKEAAAIREIKEELDFELKDFIYIGQIVGTVARYKPPYEQWHITSEVFVTKVSDDLSQFVVYEGLGAQFFTIDEVKKMNLAPNIDLKILDLFEKFIRKN